MNWRMAVAACIGAVFPALSLHAAAPGTGAEAPEVNPDHIVLVESSRVVAVYSSTISTRGAYRRAWFRVDYPVAPDAPPGTQRHWRRTLGLFDCGRPRWQVLAQLDSAANGSAPEGSVPAGVWRPVSETPAFAAVREYVCRYTGPSVSPGETIYLM